MAGSANEFRTTMMPECMKCGAPSPNGPTCGECIAADGWQKRAEDAETERDAYRSDAEAENRRAQALQGQLDKAVEVMREARGLFALGVGAMTDNGDKANQERTLTEAKHIHGRIAAFLASIPQEEEKT